MSSVLEEEELGLPRATQVIVVVPDIDIDILRITLPVISSQCFQYYAGHSLLVDELPPARGPAQASPQAFLHQVLIQSNLLSCGVLSLETGDLAPCKVPLLANKQYQSKGIVHN